MYALTTAITVQKITAACYENKLGNYCRADNSRFGEESPEGWTWGSNYNITEGTQFVEQFLDHREIINMDSSDTDMHKRAVIHLHNNAVGKSVSKNLQQKSGLNRLRMQIVNCCWSYTEMHFLNEMDSGTK